MKSKLRLPGLLCRVQSPASPLENGLERSDVACGTISCHCCTMSDLSPVLLWLRQEKDVKETFDADGDRPPAPLPMSCERTPAGLSKYSIEGMRECRN